MILEAIDCFRWGAETTSSEWLQTLTTSCVRAQGLNRFSPTLITSEKKIYIKKKKKNKKYSLEPRLAPTDLSRVISACNVCFRLLPKFNLRKPNFLAIKSTEYTVSTETSETEPTELASSAKFSQVVFQSLRVKSNCFSSTSLSSFFLLLLSSFFSALARRHGPHTPLCLRTLFFITFLSSCFFFFLHPFRDPGKNDTMNS